MLLLQSSVYRGGSALVLVLTLFGCSDDLPTAPVVPIPTTPSELAGVWSLVDSSVIATAVEETVCRNRGVVTFAAGMTETEADVRFVGTCISPRGRATMSSVMTGERVTVTGDSIAFTVAIASGLPETCQYLGRLTGGGSLGASGTVTCSRGRTGKWELSWGLAEPAEMGNLAMVEIGGAQTCALDRNGRAFCWGPNGAGQLGTGDDLPRLVPAPVAGDLRFTQITGSTYASHTCAVTSASQAYCWGNSSGGRLGDGSGAQEAIPVMEPQAVIGGHSFKQITAGGDHTCAITTSGAAYCWGFNYAGQLGTGNEAPSSTPVPVSGGLTFRQIVAYDANTCGVTTEGAAWCWGGEGWSGVLGNGGTSDSNVPVPVSGGLTFASVSVGLWMACGVTTSGDGYCWGSDFGTGNLGTGSEVEMMTTPALVTGGMKWKSIRAGGFVACGVTVTNVGYCWGQGDQGALGAGTSNRQNTNRPIPIAGGLALDQAASDFHGCALTVEGVAYCWSSGSYGQIGDGYLRFRWEPVKVAGQP